MKDPLVFFLTISIRANQACLCSAMLLSVRSAFRAPQTLFNACRGSSVGFSAILLNNPARGILATLLISFSPERKRCCLIGDDAPHSLHPFFKFLDPPLHAGSGSGARRDVSRRSRASPVDEQPRGSGGHFDTWPS